LLRLVPVKPSEDFGMLKTDGNAIGGGEFGGGYDYSHGSRLMEEEGIYYFFDHAEGGHKLGSPGSDLTELTLAGACVTMTGAHAYGGGGGAGKVHVHDISVTMPSITVGHAVVLAGKGVVIDFCKTDVGDSSVNNGGPVVESPPCAWCP